MFPEDIKKFVGDQNKEKAIQKDMDKHRNQDIRTKVQGNGSNNNSSSYGQAGIN